MARRGLHALPTTADHAPGDLCAGFISGVLNLRQITCQTAGIGALICLWTRIVQDKPVDPQMKASRSIALLPLVASLACGCCFHKDLTKSARVQTSGMLGKSFRTTEQLDLIKDTHTRILFLAKQDYPMSSRDQRVEVLAAGTELRINRVERIDELIAILVFLPEYYSWDCTLAKIEDGPHAGKEVAISGEGLLLKVGRSTATIGSGMLVPVEAETNKSHPEATASSVLTEQ